MNNYEYAKKAYADIGVDTESAIKKLGDVAISLHCWQGDDVGGFDSKERLSGGIQTTGNYPGKARSPEELKQDIKMTLSLLPGKYKLNLHACYAVFKNGFHDRNEIEPDDYSDWVEFALENDLGLDFNPTFFSHPMVKDGLTLTSPDETVRKFWVEHGKRCVKIAEFFAEKTGQTCLMNIWIPDGFKDVPADRYAPRERYMRSLDEILSVPYDKKKVYITVESKVFGIGVESYTAGNAEFCLSYALSRGITPLMDNGHYHPTEVVSDKISSLLLFNEKVALHVTRGVRWDSDHVILFDDETKEIAKEIVRTDALERVFIATDYFDASINRISAWVTGVRNLRKALLYALLEPVSLKELQNNGKFTELMIRQEALKTMPFGEVWKEYLKRWGTKEEYYEDIEIYENAVLSKRR